MPGSDALVRQILDNPSDDAPRLLYADYLEERGDPRGEFIRLQCELARMSPFDDRWSACAARERRLLFRHGAEWSESSQLLHRGFVTGLDQYQPAGIAEWGPEDFGKHPIESIWFYYQEEPGWGKAFANCEFLKNLRTIWIGGRSAAIEASDVFDMLASPHLAALEAFCITGDSMEGLNEETFLEMINHGGPLPPGLQNLRALSLDLWCGEPIMNDAGLEAVIESDLGSTLTRLSIAEQSSLTVEGLNALAESSMWQRLLELDLGFLKAVPDSFVPAWKHSQLRRLRMRTLSDQFDKLFLAAGQWGELTHLDLRDTTIPLAGFRRFVEHEAFGRLQQLRLDEPLSDEHIRLLAASPQAAGLRSLDLRQRMSGYDGLIALSQSPWCNRLCELSINNVSPEGIRAFAKSENFSRLHTFAFQSDDLGPCFDALAEASNLPALTNLSAYASTMKMGEESLPRLLASPHLRTLSYLDIFEPQTAECKEALRKADHLVWLGPHCYAADPDLARKRRFIPARLAACTAPLFSWKPP